MKKINDGDWIFAVAYIGYWISLMFSMTYTEGIRSFVIVAIALGVFWFWIVSFVFFNSSMFSKVLFYKKLIISLIPFLVLSSRFRYWVLKHLAPEVTYEEYKQIPF